MMKIYIFVDMEGISGISGSEFVTSEGLLYNLGRKYYTMDINACIKGCVAAGVTEVIVRDGHGGGKHAFWEEIDSHAELIQGATPKQRLAGIEEKTIEAIGKINDIKLPQFERPVTLRLEVIERGTIKTGPNLTVIDGRTSEVTGKTPEEALFGK